MHPALQPLGSLMIALYSSTYYSTIIIIANAHAGAWCQLHEHGSYCDMNEPTLRLRLIIIIGILVSRAQCIQASAINNKMPCMAASDVWCAKRPSHLQQLYYIASRYIIHYISLVLPATYIEQHMHIMLL